MKPEKTFRVGSVSASVFPNEMGTGDSKRTVRNVNVQRNYRADDGNWKSTCAFGLAELAQLRLVLDQAIGYVAGAESEVSNES